MIGFGCMGELALAEAPGIHGPFPPGGDGNNLGRYFFSDVGMMTARWAMIFWVASSLIGTTL